ncbi:kinesin-like protein KIN-12C [Vigna radiata var. radiata]|uniref:Kinesin-like protein KIN-12C n=1 Tax=Vigna radiata var. radiata TaxID=3916 RepID=A0A1S3USZ8_VIGRR|nr:kinesin-like protein KIN-12C [Vigna radiata var. radiata]
MWKEARTSFRRNPQSETNENELEGWQNPINFPPPRTPLNSITDPSQCQELEPARQHRFGTATPRLSARVGKPQSEPNSAQSTPARNASRVSLGGGRASACALLKETEFCVNVPHFELKDDPSFWTDHNVQVLIRIRPLSNVEKVSQGHGRCLKQESAQTLVWLGHPETRFTFDHIGCETLSQENLFRVAGVPMVENCLSGYNSCMFAYGQTGSGKTYTMMGEIKETEGYLNDDSGITPRVFDYLFMRIKAEEESRKGHKLKYSCKCSFLEIYNEQITDLLMPSSTNLQLREDLKKGVYVENLTEYRVETVYDVLRLLLQGTANRKVAATHMNCESSRSHSVFTCIIESQWEKDSMTHFRFARLNLVDLAGSERQKSSGADSERLKEAANINKSLSTLGLVIMTLVDLAHGKPRHVPYRDSRLTFLLQDSLGGNSKTMVIANVSPSICCANETLSTLKFAQRAKLIQNNAKVNEDASGDVSALQWQIQQLKGQLSFLMNDKYFPTSSNLEPNSEKFRLSEVSEGYDSLGERATADHNLLIPSKEIKCMKAALVSALRREKMAETTIQNLKAEIDHKNCLVRQREEDSEHTSSMLRHYKEKIKQLELLVDGKLTAEKYLMEENRALQEEIQLLKVKIDKNSELSTLALENDRLLRHPELSQNSYEHGERERLLTELSELRDQLLGNLQGKFTFSMKNDIDTAQELEECQNMNSKLLREVGKLQSELGKYLNYNQVLNSFEHPNEILKTDKCSLAGTISVRSDSGDEVLSSTREVNDDALANKIETKTLGASGMLAKDNEYNSNKELKAKLEKMAKDLEEVRLVNDQYQEEWIIQLSQKQETERICQEVEMETTNTILQLQEELSHLQSEFEERLCTTAHENTELRNIIAEKEKEIKSQSLDWEKAILELTTFLLEGSRSLKEACGQVKSISCSFPQVNSWICEHVDMAVKKYIEKEETILLLQNSLEDAQKMVLDMEVKLSSLREATVTLNAFQQIDKNEGIEEAIELQVLLNEKTNMIRMLENEINHKNNQLCKANKQADAAFLVAKWLSDSYKVAHMNGAVQDVSIPELDVQGKLGNCTISENQDVLNNLILNDLKAQVELTKLEVMEMENAVKASFIDTEIQTEAFQIGVSGLTSAYRDLIQDIVKETRDIRKEIRDLRMYHTSFEGYTIDYSTSNANKYQEFVNQHDKLHQIKEQLLEVNRRLNVIGSLISTEADVSSLQLVDVDEDLVNADELSTDSSSLSDLSSEIENFASEQTIDLKSERSAVIQSDDCKSSNPGKLTERPVLNEVLVSCLSKELSASYDGFQRLYLSLSAFLRELDDGFCSYSKELKREDLFFQLSLQKDEAESGNDREIFGFGETRPDDRFLTKFMEAHATVKEADLTLHALTKAYEDSKQLTAMWKQSGEILMLERASLEEEIQKLKSSVCHKEEENQLLKDNIHFSLIEMANSVSMLEEHLLQIQTDVEKKLLTMYSDILLTGKEMLDFMKNMRSLVEDIFSQMVDGGSVSFVLYNCCVTELVSKFACATMNLNLQSARHGELHFLEKISSSVADPVISTGSAGAVKTNECVLIQKVPEQPDLPNVILYENMALRKELERKQVLLEGLLFDFRLLQESASNSKDIKDQTEKLICSLSQVRYELETKASQLDDILVQNRKLEGSLVNTGKALTTSQYELKLAKESIEKLSNQNVELRELLKDLYAYKTEAEGKLDEHREVIRGLEKEITNLTASLENQSLSLFENIEDELNQVIIERDQLREEVCVLTGKLEMAYSLADEKEAIAMEAHQESESSKLFAEQKDEEVKILEHSVEELESTINVLEKKVHEMDEEVGRHRSISDSLRMELQALKERLLLVDKFPKNVDSGSTSVQTDEQISRQHNEVLELHEALSRIRFLEKENAEQDKEIKRCKEYISEIVLHAEAQASQYQQKYKCLESMFLEVKTETSNSTSVVPAPDKNEKISVRTRGSSSPFRCISNLVQQMNQERDQELSVARLRVEELETLAARRQNEVFVLQTRLAATENMTHDVIRDLLGVKLDITDYANLIDENQIVKLVEEAQHHREEFLAKERENLDLRQQINDLVEERESCISELKTKEADILATQIALQQLQERDQLLCAQNEMLKMDKTNLLRKVAELDDAVKTLVGTRNSHLPPQSSKTKDKGAINMGTVGSSKRLSQPERRLSRLNDEPVRFRKFAGNNNSQG